MAQLLAIYNGIGAGASKAAGPGPGFVEGYYGKTPFAAVGLCMRNGDAKCVGFARLVAGGGQSIYHNAAAFGIEVVGAVATVAILAVGAGISFGGQAAAQGFVAGGRRRGGDPGIHPQAAQQQAETGHKFATQKRGSGHGSFGLYHQN